MSVIADIIEFAAALGARKVSLRSAVEGRYLHVILDDDVGAKDGLVFKFRGGARHFTTSSMYVGYDAHEVLNQFRSDMMKSIDAQSAYVERLLRDQEMWEAQVLAFLRPDGAPTSRLITGVESFHPFLDNFSTGKAVVITERCIDVPEGSTVVDEKAYLLWNWDTDAFFLNQKGKEKSPAAGWLSHVFSDILYRFQHTHLISVDAVADKGLVTLSSSQRQSFGIPVGSYPVYNVGPTDVDQIEKLVRDEIARQVATTMDAVDNKRRIEKVIIDHWLPLLHKMNLDVIPIAASTLDCAYGLPKVVWNLQEAGYGASIPEPLPEASVLVAIDIDLWTGSHKGIRDGVKMGATSKVREKQGSDGKGEGEAADGWVDGSILATSAVAGAGAVAGAATTTAAAAATATATAAGASADTGAGTGADADVAATAGGVDGVDDKARLEYMHMMKSELGMI